MDKIDSILVLSDLSDAAQAAHHRAAEIAANHGAGLRLLHFDETRIAPGPDPVPKLRWKARRLARLYGLPVTVADRPARSVAEVGGEVCRADLLVKHHRRAPRVLGPWRRDVSEKLVELRPVPVLVVKGASAWKPYASVLAAVDLRDEAARRVVAWACAAGGSADVDVLHVVRLVRPGAIRLADISADAQRYRRWAALQHGAGELQRILGSIAAPYAGRPRPALVVGDSVEREILARQAESGAQLIALGRSTDTPWVDMLLGSVSRRILAAAPGDVLIVPVAAHVAGSQRPDVASRARLPAAQRDGTNG